jgi:hypothetical protein
MSTHSAVVPDLAVPVLTDEDVLERVRSHADQNPPPGRSLLLMFLSCDGTQLPTAVAIDDVPEHPEPELLVNLCEVVASVLADAAPCGSVVITMSRPGPLTATEADRGWVYATRRAARRTGVPLRMMCLAGASGVRQLTSTSDRTTHRRPGRRRPA